MKKLNEKWLLFLVLPLFLTGCLNNQVEQSQKENSELKEITTLANPATANCLEKGGQVVVKENKKGQYGVCIFEDNRQCEEWALFRGLCSMGGKKITGYEDEAQVYCVITGGEVQGLGTATPMCKRVDGTLCTVQANFDGDCPDPNDPSPNAGNVETP